VWRAAATGNTYAVLRVNTKYNQSSSSSSSAYHNPLLDIGLSNISLDLRLLASSSCQPSCANRHSTWPEGVLHYVYLDAVSTPEIVYPAVIGSTADMASPLPLQHGITVCYVGDFSSLPDHLVSDSIPQRNPEHSSFHSLLSDLKLVDQPCRECPRLGSVCHDR
jgi:hypothetical protein